MKQYNNIITLLIVWWITSTFSIVTAQTVNLELPNSKVLVTLDGTGRWGIDDGTAGQLGFVYNGNDLLKNTTTNRNEAGLMLGVSTTKVSDVVKTSTTNRNTDFALQGNIGAGNTAGGFKEYVALYKEAGGVTNPLGIQVTQKLYGWNTGADEGFVIVEYRLKNTTSDTIKQLSLGIFADWNLGTMTENRANWDSSNQLGYVYESGGSGNHVGIALLTAQTPQYYAFDQDGTAGSINIGDGFSKAEKYQSMASNLERTQAGANGNGNDVAHTVGARLITLAPGKTSIVAFAIVAGTSLTNLQNRVQTATNRFKAYHASPAPTLPADLKVCGPAGETTLTPTGGTQFRFYDQIPTPGVTTPIGEGTDLRAQNIQANRTIYVTSIDSLYEGTHSSITIRYVYPTAVIEDGIRELCVNGTLTLQATTGNTGISYQWQRNGQNIGSNNTNVLINQAGTYQVTVTEEGCSRTSAPVTITQIATPLISQSGTELSVNVPGAKTYQWFYNDLPLTGATNAAYIPRAPGTYTLSVGFGNGCEVLSNAFEVEVTSIANMPKLKGVKVYPVPNAGSCTLELPQNIGRRLQLALIDLSGRTQYSAIFVDKQHKVALELPQYLPTGIYFLQITTGQKQAIIKLAIQR
ncbi:T9SS type A sorting domain-containing protein [Microscilla marina]|uniref:Secretion system C-terminal sorting domain-containing protein n=1 Tax=Microscilla marina ATCC 23134 TaxID=313606 RepID=A1ZSH0_MICM2|nr:T9SS type A sorting domain-containing protein [Microscilla marina]EAY26718.1 hypothetical protein M23134_02969 [Microscilla marina ATCC 23134]